MMSPPLVLQTKQHFCQCAWATLTQIFCQTFLTQGPSPAAPPKIAKVRPRALTEVAFFLLAGRSSQHQAFPAISKVKFPQKDIFPEMFRKSETVRI